MGKLGDLLRWQPTAYREAPEPLEGTRMSLFNSIIPNWWAENMGTAGWFPGDANLANQVWIANTCQHKNSQQISTMPLKWNGPPDPTASPPEWLSSPDPNLFPNGISDAMYAIVNQLYGWGYSLQYVTDYYATGWPRHWTVLDSSRVTPKFEDGARVYQTNGGGRIDASRVVQIDRNPTLAAHGTSAIAAYAQIAWGLLAAGNQSMNVSQGGIPQVVLKSEKRLSGKENADGENQARLLQDKWMEATSRRNGAPPVLGPDLDFKTLGFNPADMSLIETQQWDAMMLCNAYGTPSVLMNMALAGGLTYQNPSALGEFWWRFELRNVATRIENALSEQMLPRGQFVTVDASDTFAPITPQSEEDDPQRSGETPPMPMQPQLTAIGGTG